MRNDRWNFGDFEITRRELMACITIIAVMFISGFTISGKVSDFQMDKNAEYYKAAQITDSEMFRYGMDTSIGNAFVYGSLEAVDTVTFPEIGGEYLYVEKVEEHYNKHTRTVTTTDGKGKIHTRTEVYWSWDYAGSENAHSNKIRFCGVEMDYGKVSIQNADYIDTINESGSVRFKYYGCKGPYTGTIYADLRNGTISDTTKFHESMEIAEVLENKTSEFWIVGFWVAWIILMGIMLFGFVYLDNRWLEN